MKRYTYALIIFTLIFLVGVFFFSKQTFTFSEEDCITDLNKDRITDSLDLIEFKENFGKDFTENSQYDFNGDSLVNSLDFNLLISSIGKTCK
jgi:hypothetical protein